MLLRTMFLLALIALLAETIVHGASALAQSALHFRALGAARMQFETAVAMEERAIAGALAAGGDPLAAPLPSATPGCVLTEGSVCRLLAQSRYALAAAVPGATPGACPQTACTVYLQGNDRVAEGRVAVQISTQITAPNGAILASRSAIVKFRTFHSPPYVTLAGSLDATLDGMAGSGDDGGASGAAATLVNVEYVNAANPRATPVAANVWRPRVQAPAAAANAWDY